MPTGQPGALAAETPPRAPAPSSSCREDRRRRRDRAHGRELQRAAGRLDGHTIDPKYGVSPARASSRRRAGAEGRRARARRQALSGRRPDLRAARETPAIPHGLASWYGDDFHGRLTANGEVFDRDSIAAAHPTMPLPSYARVTNVENRHSMIVRVNDRGPYHGNRIIDVSERVAEALGFKRRAPPACGSNMSGAPRRTAATTACSSRPCAPTAARRRSRAARAACSRRSRTSPRRRRPGRRPRLPRRAALRRAGGAGSARPGRAGLQPPPEPDRGRRRRAEPESRVASGVPLPPSGRSTSARSRTPASRCRSRRWRRPAGAPRFRRAVLRAAAAAAGAVREVGSVPGHEAAALRRP